jgi:hypothetical protein
LPCCIALAREASLLNPVIRSALRRAARRSSYSSSTPLFVFPKSRDFVLQPEAKEQNPSFPEKSASHPKGISGAGK